MAILIQTFSHLVIPHVRQSEIGVDRKPLNYGDKADGWLILSRRVYKVFMSLEWDARNGKEGFFFLGKSMDKMIGSTIRA
jgi:hypothetical protein